MSLFDVSETKLNPIHISHVEPVLPGQIIRTEAGFIRGHGTYEKDEQLFATVSGIVEQVNKLISVRPLKSRYTGDVGDVVVGRITEVGPKRWRVDVNGKQDAALLLSSINLPDGELRRRTKEDALQMRNFFVENDLISAEVQQFYSDGSMSLHTRNLKYGKLENGQFVEVPPALIKRCKSHFKTLSCGVDIILGNNGYIFLSMPKVDSNNQKTIQENRLKISRVRNSILALSNQFIAIYPKTIMTAFKESLPYQPKDMLKPDIIKIITQPAAYVHDNQLKIEGEEED